MPRNHALAEINRRYNRPSVFGRKGRPFAMSLRDALAAEPQKPKPDMSDAEFSAALQAMGILSFEADARQGKKVKR